MLHIAEMHLKSHKTYVFWRKLTASYFLQIKDKYVWHHESVSLLV